MIEQKLEWFTPEEKMPSGFNDVFVVDRFGSLGLWDSDEVRDAGRGDVALWAYIEPPEPPKPAFRVTEKDCEFARVAITRGGGRARLAYWNAGWPVALHEPVGDGPWFAVLYDSPLCHYSGDIENSRDLIGWADE